MVLFIILAEDDVQQTGFYAIIANESTMKGWSE